MPPEACSNSPRWRAEAPVNAAASWPNSSLASTLSASAAQFSATNGPSARRLPSWSARATSSLPAPVSPSTSTGSSLGATRTTRAISWRIGSLPATSFERRTRISGSPSMSRRTSRIASGCGCGTNAAGITCRMRARSTAACTRITHKVCACGVPADSSTSVAHTSGGALRSSSLASGTRRANSCA